MMREKDENLKCNSVRFVLLVGYLRGGEPHNFCVSIDSQLDNNSSVWQPWLNNDQVATKMSLIFLILISLLITTEGETNRVSLTQALWRLNRGGGGWSKGRGVWNGNVNYLIITCPRSSWHDTSRSDRYNQVIHIMVLGKGMPISDYLMEQE